jgi:hypothetical protein
MPKIVGANQVSLSPCPDEFPGLKTLNEEDISDRSKQDWLAKGFVLAQTTWFVTQCIARKVQNIDLTELELVACAYALLSAVIYGFWWKKPFDVTRPIQAIRKLERDLDPPVDWKGKIEEFRYLLAGVAYDNIDFMRRSRVPTFYSGRLTPGQDVEVLIAEVVTAVIFGGIHLIAWRFVFPTEAEQIMWRASAIAITMAPFVWLIMFSPDAVPDAATDAALITTIPIYIIARLILLAISFSSLRALPLGAFIAVNWTTFIPHVS